MVRSRLAVWAKSAAMLAMFAILFVALTRLLRAYSYDQITGALANLSPGLAGAAIGVLAVQMAVQVVREALAVGYAKRRDLSLRRVALASIVARSLSSLGFSSITGVGLRLHIYEGWGLTTGEVAEIAVYDNAVFAVGVAAQFGLAFTLLPIPARLAVYVPGPLVRVIGIAALALVAAYIAWSRRGRELRIRKLVIPAPTPRQLAGQIFLPVIDLALTAVIVQLCLPDGLGLSYLDVVIVCLVASVASSISQLPAGIGVMEGTALVFADKPDLAPSIIAGLFVWRMITNLLPIAIGAVLIVILEVRRHAAAAVPHPHTQTTATALAALTFAIGAVVMIASVSPLGERLGDLAQVLSVATGAGILFVARGLQRRRRIAWQLALALLAVRAAIALVVGPVFPLLPLAMVAGLLAWSRHVFAVEKHPYEPSPRWWIAAGMVLSVALWVAFLANGRALSPLLEAEAGAMFGVAALAVAAAVFG